MKILSVTIYRLWFKRLYLLGNSIINTLKNPKTNKFEYKKDGQKKHWKRCRLEIHGEKNVHRLQLLSIVNNADAVSQERKPLWIEQGASIKDGHYFRKELFYYCVQDSFILSLYELQGQKWKSINKCEDWNCKPRCKIDLGLAWEFTWELCQLKILLKMSLI